MPSVVAVTSGVASTEPTDLFWGTLVCLHHQRVYAAAEDLDEMNIEIMRNTLYKAYLDDFAKFCNKMGGSTAAVMGDLLSFEVVSDLAIPVMPCLSSCL